MKDISKRVTKIKPGGPQLLVVEKDQAMTGRLENLFPVVYASDETKALELLERESLQGILIEVESDLPSSLALCRRIKTNELTAEIPVILMLEAFCEGLEIECLKAGADDVISRTASQDLIEKKINGILERESLSIPRSNFLQWVDEVVHQHLKNSNFKVETLATLLRMDRKTLYRKVKSTSGLTPQLYIRKCRLELALQLLNGGEFSISEVSSRVGFHDLSYFSSCFKRHFGKLPSECKHCLVS